MAEMKLVPVEPTPEQIEPFARQWCISNGIDPDEPTPPHGEWPRWYDNAGPFAEMWKTISAALTPREEAPAEGAGDARELAVLLDNLVIAQSLSRDLREAATDQARSYLYDLRARTSEPEATPKPAPTIEAQKARNGVPTRPRHVTSATQSGYDPEGRRYR